MKIIPFSQPQTASGESAFPEPASGAAIYTGIAALAIFAFFRPITVSFHHVGSISILDIFGIASSYLMMLALVINLKNLRLPGVAYGIVFYVLYCLLSFVWGSGYRDVFRAITPFLTFFLAAAAVRTPKQVNFLLALLSLGYVLPVLGSMYLVLTGRSAVMTTGSMLERQSGLSSGVHTLGHLMLFFSFVYFFYLLVNQRKNTLHLLLMTGLLVGSFFCTYKTYTRTVFMGALIFWSMSLWFTSKRWFVYFVAALALVTVVKYSDIHHMILQKRVHTMKYDLNSASSGRELIWNYNLKMYAKLPLTTELLGVGLGNELDFVPGTYTMWAGSHNDYLSLLVTLGAFGVLLYLIIYGNLLFVIMSRWRHEMRVFALSLIISVILMNLVSNSYIVRYQMAQLFWFLIGLMYAWQRIGNEQVFSQSQLEQPRGRLVLARQHDGI